MKQKSIAIIGGGPAGATLGALLAKDGFKVGIYHTAKRPELIIGESLLPAVVPILRELGIEDEVRSFSIHKPGATVWLSPDEIVPFEFGWAKGELPNYAYNTPRKEFDEAILNVAIRNGAKLVPHSAKLRQEGNSVCLENESIAASDGLFDTPPDLIVDATGRSRQIAKLLSIPTKKGKRKDTALFAHLDSVVMTSPGHIHVDRYEKGWGWRIPLPGRVSVGIVVDPVHLKNYGDRAEEQFDNFIKDNTCIGSYSKDSRRLTSVIKYSNYQLISQKMVGENWACIGDAAGFVDPVFSTGAYLAMKSGQMLYKAIKSDTKEAFEAYEKKFHWELTLWQKVINTWYNGRLFSLYRAGQTMRNNFIGRGIEPHIEKHLSRIFTGEAVNGIYSRGLLEFMSKFALLVRSPKDLKIN